MKKLLQILFLSVLGLPVFAQTQILAPMPAQTGTFSGNVRGYYFVSPTCFTITGVQVPTDANSGNQSIAIVRFWNNTIPPTFSATTNAFTVLYLTQDNTNGGILPVNIQVDQGDVIGVLGCRTTTTSYSSTGNTTTINGYSIPLTRMGMQFPLTTTPPQQLWTEATANIGRVNLYYDSLITYNAVATVINTTDASFTNGADSTFLSVWNYGDGSPLDTAWNPTHTYAIAGVYNVCSYITNSCGTDTVCTSVSFCGPDPIASYTYSAAGGLVAFTNSTNNSTSWTWDFGDGSPVDNSQNPTHTYSQSGTYTVCMIASNGCSPDDTICSSVTVCIPVAANYSVTNTNFGTVDFADGSSAATSWAWDFGDNSPIDNSQNPTHTYTASGTYTVCLIASSACSADTFCSTVTVCVQTASAYTIANQVFGAVDFADASTDATSWSWDFGDSSPLDNSQNPSHTYATGGVYTVCLVAANACSADTFCTNITVCLPVAATYSVTNMNGGTVDFGDASTEATSWSWDFGDGSPVDNSQNPSHTYATGGVYTVCLIASNACSADTFCTAITVCVPVTASFSTGSINGGVVNFTDASTEATSWSWDFGDSQTSTSQNPTNTYTANGTYNVCLIVTNACSADTFCTTVTVCPVTLAVDFSSAGTTTTLSFTDMSTGATGWSWDFGDSQTSSQQNPTHTYAANGMYTVCLSAWNDCGDTLEICHTQNVNVGISEQNANASVSLYPNPFTEQSVLNVQSTVYNGAFVFEVYDARGAIVLTQQGNFNERLTIDGSALASGIYFYKIRKDATVIDNGKLIINK